jgi:hypothetical protein
MTTLKEIFSLNLIQLDQQIRKYDEKYKRNDYSISGRINILILYSFNNNHLNEEESKIVKSEEYNKVMKTQPRTYEEFINKFIKIK